MSSICTTCGYDNSRREGCDCNDRKRDNKMIHIEAIFGSGCDEQAETDALEDMIGRDRCNILFRLCQNSYPSGTEYDRLYGNGKTKDQVFLRKARGMHFTEKELQAYCHVAHVSYETA